MSIRMSPKYKCIATLKPMCAKVPSDSAATELLTKKYCDKVCTDDNVHKYMDKVVMAQACMQALQEHIDKGNMRFMWSLRVDRRHIEWEVEVIASTKLFMYVRFVHNGCSFMFHADREKKKKDEVTFVNVRGTGYFNEVPYDVTKENFFPEEIFNMRDMFALGYANFEAHYKLTFEVTDAHKKRIVLRSDDEQVEGCERGE